MSKNLIIIGARAMGRETCNYARDSGFIVKGFLDSDSSILNGFVGYPPVIATVEGYLPADDEVFICAIGDPGVKKHYVRLMEAKGAKFVSVIHPSAYVGPNVVIGEGSIISVNVTLTCDIKIGCHVIVNVNSTISHDCFVGDFSSISPGCSIAGRVSLDEKVFLGVGVKVIPDISLGAEISVGAGAVITKSWKSGILVGVPACLKK